MATPFGAAIYYHALCIINYALLRVSDQQQPMPYQPRCLRTS